VACPPGAGAASAMRGKIRRRSSVQFVAPSVRGRPGTSAGCGPATSCRAGRSPWTNGTNEGGRSGTAGSPILSVRPPRDSRTMALDKYTCQTGGQRRVPRAAAVGCLAATAGHPRSSPRWRPLPWGPPLGACRPGGSRAGPPRVGQCPSPQIPPGFLAGIPAPRGPTGAPQLAG